MIRIKIPSHLHITSDKKAERRDFFKFLATEIPKSGSKLVPVPLEIFQDLTGDYKTIYRVSNMEKVPFGRQIKELCPNSTFYAATMWGYGGKGRIRKFAHMKFDDGREYILFQQSVDYTNTLSLLDVKNKTRQKFKSVHKLIIYFKILKAPISEIPLLINHPYVEQYPEFKKAVYKRLENG